MMASLRSRNLKKGAGGWGSKGGLAKDQTFYRFFLDPSPKSLKCPERLAGNRNVAWRRKSAPECRLRRGWKRKRPRLGDNNHNTLSFGIQFQLSSKHIFASNAHEKHLNGLTLATTSPKPMHYGKVSLGGVTFRISNFSPTLEENITFTFYFNDFVKAMKISKIHIFQTLNAIFAYYLFKKQIS